jgi:hypothetical protein
MADPAFRSEGLSTWEQREEAEQKTVVHSYFSAIRGILTHSPKVDRACEGIAFLVNRDQVGAWEKFTVVRKDNATPDQKNAEILQAIFSPTTPTASRTPAPALKISAVPGFENVSFLKDLPVVNGTVTSGDQPCPWVCLSGEITVNKFPQFEILGKCTGKFHAFSRNTPEGLRPAFLFFPSIDALKKLDIMSEEPLSTLTKCLVLTYAPRAHVWKFQDLPTPVQNALRSETVIESGEILFEETSGFVFGCKPQDVPVLRDILKVFLNSVKTMVISGTRPKVMTDPMRLRGSFQTGFNSKVFPPGFAVSDAEIEFHGMQVALLGKLQFKLSESIHLDGLGLRIDFPKPKAPNANLTISAIVPGEWKNPLGIKGWTLRGLVLSGQVGTSPGVGMKGTIDFGRTVELAGAMAFNSPVAVSALSGKLDQLSLKDVINGVNSLLRQGAGALKLPDPGTANIPVDIIRISDVEVTIAKTANPALNLNEGLTIRGKMNIAGADIGEVDIRVITDKGFVAKAWVSKFNLGPVELTGAGPDQTFGTDDDCPFLDLEYLVDVNAKPLPKLNSHGFISGKIKLGPVNLDALFTMNKSDYALTLMGKIPGDFAIGLEGKGPITQTFVMSSMGKLKLTGFVEAPFVGRLDDSVMDKVKDTPVIKDVVGFISGSIFSMRGITLNGDLQKISEGVIPGVSLGCRILGKDLGIDGPSLDLKEGAKFGEKVGLILYDQVVLKIRDLGLDIGQFFKNVGEETAKFAEARAKETAEVAVKVGNQIKDTGIVIGKTFENLGVAVGNEAKKFGLNVGNGFIYIGNQIGTGFDKAGNAIKNAFEDGWNAFKSIF